MKQLVCEMCGSTDLIKQDGVFVCQTCGCKYSVEEAKKMMVEGTVRVDNTHMISNYLEMAQSARDAGNNAEAETYCNKVIEIEPGNYQAWMLKGEAAAWQSSIQDMRVDEGVAAFVKGINNAPEEEKEVLIERAKEQIKELSLALISVRGDRFVQWPDNEEASGFLTDLTSIMGTVAKFLSETGALVPVNEIMGPVATLINSAVVNAYQNKIIPDYTGNPNDPDDRPSKYEFSTYIERVGYCTTLLTKAIELCDEDDEEDIQRYENLITLHKNAIDACSWDYDFDGFGGKYWHKDYELTNDAKVTRRNLINQYEGKIRELRESIAKKQEEEKRKRIDAYWAEHSEERDALESEKKNLLAQIKTIEKEKESVPGKEEKELFQGQIDKLTTEKSMLGLLKRKEKAALQERIDALSNQLNAVVSRMEAQYESIQKKIEPLQKRVNQIDLELTKDPQTVTSSPKSVLNGTYHCPVCGYSYNPSDNGNVAFETLPDDWNCPICLAASKSSFKPDGVNKTNTELNKDQQETTASHRIEHNGAYNCSICGYSYNPSDNGNVAFETLPANWNCPICRAPKSSFKPWTKADL